MDQKLRELQLIQLEILKVVDEICREHDIHYSLYAGTLLGAVRHRGFIPWDDDLDICLERKQYDKFISVWNEVQPEGYLLQNKENTPKFSQSFTKIRKEHTTFLQDEKEGGKYHTGVFIDVFPVDRIPNGKVQRFLFKWHCMLYQLLTREFVPPKSNVIVRLVSGVLLTCIPKRKRARTRRKLLECITKYNDNKAYHTVAIETMESLRVEFPADMLETYTKLPFEDGHFMCFDQWEEHLTRAFGDYMKLPPEQEQTWRHHPVILDFAHSYDEL